MGRGLRGEGTHTENRLHREGTTWRGDDTARGLHGEKTIGEDYTRKGLGGEKTTRGEDYTGRGLHGPEITPKRDYTGKGLHGEGTHTEGGLHEKETTRRRDYMGRITRGGDAHMLYWVSLRRFFTENFFFMCSGLLRSTIR